MSSLANCLKEITDISDIEKKLIGDAAQAYRDEGYSGQDANVGAVTDILNDLEKEQKSILKEVGAAFPEPKELLTKSQVEGMLEGFYERNQDLYDSYEQFANQDPEITAMELENDRETYEKYLKNFSEEFDLEENIRLYQEGKLEPEKKKAKPALKKKEVAKPQKVAAPVTKASEKDLKKAKRFRTIAKNQQKQIDEKRRDMTQNPTPKRMKEYYSRLHDADNLERTQQAFNAMADALEAGTLPEILSGVITKDSISTLVRKGLTSGGGYYDVIPSGEYSDTSEKGKTLQALMEKSLSGEQIEEQEKRAKEKELKDLEETVRFSKIPGFFPTPEPVIDTMLQYADIQPGMEVLEPSAGKGDIADKIKERTDADLSVIERQHTLRQILQAKDYELVGDDFLEHEGQYDRIIQNPPFEKGQDIDHVRHAYDQLKPGGRLVSVMSTGPFFRSDKKATSFREWFESVEGTEYEKGQVFKGIQAFRQTGTTSKVVVIEKPVAKEAKKPQGRFKRIPENARDFRDWVRLTGGVRPNDPSWKGELKDIAYTVDREGRKKLAKGFGYGFFSRKARGIDERTTDAIEAGWLPEGATDQDFMDLVEQNPARKQLTTEVRDVDILAQEEYYNAKEEAKLEYSEEEIRQAEAEADRAFAEEEESNSLSKEELNDLYRQADEDFQKRWSKTAQKRAADKVAEDFRLEVAGHPATKKRQEGLFDKTESELELRPSEPASKAEELRARKMIKEKEEPETKLAAQEAPYRLSPKQFRRIPKTTRQVVAWLKKAGMSEAELTKVRIELKPIIDLRGKEVSSTIEQHGDLGVDVKQVLGATTFNKYHALIELSLNANSLESLEKTVYHERFHLATQWLLPKADRDQILKHYKNEEDAANAFAEYMKKGRLAKLPSALRKIFLKMRRYLRALRNGLNARGFNVPEDIFGQILVGAYQPHFGGPERTNIAFQTKGPVPWAYSQLLRAVETAKDMPAKVQSLKNWFLKKNVKPEELKWMDVDNWLKENQKDGKIDKAAFLDFLKANQIEMREVMKGGPSDTGAWVVYDGEDESYFDTEIDAIKYAKERDLPETDDTIFFKEGAGGESTKYATYQLPGGKEYREMVVTLPTTKTKEVGGYEVFRDGESMGRSKTEDGAKSRVASLEANPDNAGYSFTYRKATEQIEAGYRSSHFDEPNVLAHIRFNERTDAEGNKVLFIEEVQSDWLQEAKEKGFKGEVDPEAEARFNKEIGEFNNKLKEKLKFSGHAYEWAQFRDKWMTTEEKAELQDINRKRSEASQYGRVPPAPFLKNWPELMMKRMIRYAAENGFDKVAWTKGAHQIDRYNEALRQNVDRIAWSKKGDVVAVSAEKEGKVVFGKKIPLTGTTTISGKEVELKDVVGKPIAQQITSSAKTSGTFKGEDLSIGGMGMRSFYDELLPGTMDKYVKQWGAKVGESRVPVEARAYSPERELAVRKVSPSEWEVINDEEKVLKEGFNSLKEAHEWAESYRPPPRAETVHSIPITPEMKESVLYQGQTMFSPERYSDRLIREVTQDMPAKEKAKAEKTVKAEEKQVVELPLKTVQDLNTKKIMSAVNKTLSAGTWKYKNKKDLRKIIDLVLSTPLHYAERIPTFGRMFDAANKKIDIQNEMIDRLTKDPVTGKHFTRMIEHFKKVNPREYRPLSKYLVDNDRNQIGYNVQLNEDTGEYDIYAPASMKVGEYGTYKKAKAGIKELAKREKKNEAIYRAYQKGDKWVVVRPTKGKIASLGNVDDAWAEARKREAEDYRKRFNASDDAVQALLYYRQTVDNGFNVLMQNMRDLIAWYEKTGYEMPSTTINIDGDAVQVDLKVALAKMGDRRGYYFPRIRNTGGIVMVATKGDQKWMNSYDWALEEPPAGEISRGRSFMKMINAASPMGIKAREMRRQGYKVTFEKAETLPEDVFVEQVRRIINIQAELNASLRAMQPEKLSLSQLGIDFVDRKITGGKASGQRDFAVFGQLSKAQREILQGYGGRWYSAQAGEPKGWHFINPGRGFEERLVRGLMNVSNMVDKQTMDIFAEQLTEAVANIERARGHRAHMIQRDMARGDDVWQGYETDMSTALAKYVASLAGGESKKIMTGNLIKQFHGIDISWPEFKEAKMFEGDFEQFRADNESVAMNEDEFSEINDPEGFEENAKKIEDLKKEREGAQGEEREEISNQLQDAYDWLYSQHRDLVEERRIDAQTQPNAWKDAKSYIENMLRNDETVDRVLGFAKGLAVFKYLAGRVSAPAVNLTALVTSVPGAMNVYGGIPIRKAFSLVGKYGKKYGDYKLRNKEGLKEEELWVFEQINQKGWDAAQFNREALTALESKVGKGYRNIIDWLMFPFGVTEQFNRASTIAGSYFGIKESKPELSQEKALNLAKEVSDKAHAVYNRANRPAWARGSTVLGNMARAFYVFKTFSHNYLQLISKAWGPGWTPAHAKAFSYLAISPAIVAGTGAVVGKEVLVAMAKALGLGGDDPEEKLYEFIADSFGDTAEDLARYGVIGLLGINLKGSLSIGITDIPTDLKDVLGAPGDMLITEPYRMAMALRRGNVLKAIEHIPVMPLFLANPIKALRESTEGVTSWSNTPVFYGNEPLKADWVDALLRTFSFNPVDVAKPREIQWSERKIEEKYRKRKTDIYSKFKKYYLSGDRDNLEYLKLLGLIKDFNQRIRDNGLAQKGIVTLITKNSLKSSLRRVTRPPKRERLRAVNE